jgi:hypothetical protein
VDFSGFLARRDEEQRSQGAGKVRNRACSAPTQKANQLNATIFKQIKRVSKLFSGRLRNQGLLRKNSASLAQLTNITQ